MAAVLHGSAHVTADLDVCYRREPEDLERIVRADRPADPRMRGGPPELPFLWDAKTLRAGLDFTLTTDAGDFDLLGEVAGLGDYSAVQARAVPLPLYGHETWVLSLEGLIAARETARPKDLYLLPELRALLALRDEREAPAEATQGRSAGRPCELLQTNWAA